MGEQVMDLEALKQRVCDEVDRRASLLVEVSHDIHDHPELGFVERYAHDRLASVLEAEGLATERGAFGVDTAFRATAGRGRNTVAVLCEYDALPGLGHACGHNIIAAAGLGAGLALATVADAAGGGLVVLGTPAEEGGGGKIVLAERGAFDGIDAALMVHPADADLQWMSTLALHQVDVVYEGQAAHAAAFPWDGRNALDAAVLGYLGVAALRQHLRPGERVHGIITDGGERANIVPRRAAMEWIVRSPTLAGLEALKARVLTCLQAGPKRPDAPCRPSGSRCATPRCETTGRWRGPTPPTPPAWAGSSSTPARATRSWPAPTWATCRTSCRRSTP
jgi:amidohydrolase